jgi:fucose 4-O-acetylase-like acetyltransferase
MEEYSVKSFLDRWYHTSSIAVVDGKKINYYINNLKFILIVLVVLGHFTAKMTYVKEIKYIFYFIYIFHMPCFVFISGYLAKRMNSGGKLRVDKILSLLWMYFIFKAGLVVFGHLLNKCEAESI